MPDPYLGELCMVAFDYAPDGWLVCNGSLAPTESYPALFELIGTTYGGDGVTTFGVPDLRGRTPLHRGAGANLSPRSMGQMGGEATVTLTLPQIPNHALPIAGYVSLPVGDNSPPYPTTPVLSSSPSASLSASNLPGTTSSHPYNPDPPVGPVCYLGNGLIADGTGNTDINYITPAAAGSSLRTINGVGYRIFSPGTTGSNAPHDNMSPSLAINFLISTIGVTPQPSAPHTN